MQPSINSQSGGQKGSILIAIIAVVMIASVMITYGIDYFKVRTEGEDRVATRENMEFVVHQLASYAQKNNRVPCPANPALLPNNPLYGREWVTSPGSTDCVQTEGVLPARDLFLPETYMRDSWRFLYTYAIGKEFSHTDVSVRLFANCRTNGSNNTNTWVKDGIQLNVDKARFCCPDGFVYPAGTRLDLRDTANASMAQRSSAAGDYAAANSAVGNLSANNIQSYAIVLISHGEGGAGAYEGNGSLTKNSSTGAGTAEIENADGDQVYRLAYTDRSQTANAFDDIVIGRTQYQLMADLNSGSCMRPFYANRN